MKLNVVNAEDVWDFDSGDYSGVAKTAKPDTKSKKTKNDHQQKVQHQSTTKSVNKGDVDDIFDDLGEEEF